MRWWNKRGGELLKKFFFIEKSTTSNKQYELLSHANQPRLIDYHTNDPTVADLAANQNNLPTRTQKRETTHWISPRTVGISISSQ
jgi:hypothetical protein